MESVFNASPCIRFMSNASFWRTVIKVQFEIHVKSSISLFKVSEIRGSPHHLTLGVNPVFVFWSCPLKLVRSNRREFASYQRTKLHYSQYEDTQRNSLTGITCGSKRLSSHRFFDHFNHCCFRQCHLAWRLLARISDFPESELARPSGVNKGDGAGTCIALFIILHSNCSSMSKQSLHWSFPHSFSH
jgi:hypothetical protein